MESNSRNEIVVERESNENTVYDEEPNIEEANTLRQLHQLYGKDFNEDGETVKYIFTFTTYICIDKNYNI